MGAVRLESMLWGWGTKRKPIKDFIWSEQDKGLVRFSCPSPSDTKMEQDNFLKKKKNLKPLF